MEQEKDIMPYNLYTSDNFKKKIISIDECIDCCKKQFEYKNIGKDIDELEQQEFINKFLYNCKRWNCINNNKIDILDYSSNIAKWIVKYYQKVIINLNNI